jgi:hypothetical protein
MTAEESEGFNPRRLGFRDWSPVLFAGIRNSKPYDIAQIAGDATFASLLGTEARSDLRDAAERLKDRIIAAWSAGAYLWSAAT